MNHDGFQRLEEVVLDPLFAEVDIDLRQGRHVNQHETDRYGFLRDAQAHLEPFYRQYDCELRRATEGFFYLVPTGGRLGRRRLTLAEMLVGQVLCVLRFDPANVESSGVITNEQVVRRLAALVGEERLMAVLNPRRKRHDDRVAQENVRDEVEKALRGLAGLGFVDAVNAGQIRLCPSLLRFAGPVHGLEDRAQALERLISEGEITLKSDDENNVIEDEA